MNTFIFNKISSQSIRIFKKMHRILLIGLPLGSFFGAHASEWTVLLYIQADGMLNKAAYASLNAIASRLNKQSDKKLRVYAELICAEQRHRYYLDSAGINSCTEFAVLASPCEDLKEACKWAFQETISKYTMIILSGHATGILEPQWDEKKARWVCAPVGADSAYSKWLAHQNELLLKRVDKWEDCKSIFVQNTIDSCHLSTKQISALLHEVTQECLLGRKFTIVGFDACNMGMLEIAYDIQQSAHFMIASQECEEKEGWDYGKVMDALLEENEPSCAARKIVYGYERMQRKKEQEIFSLSAFDVAVVSALVACLDTAVKEIESCLYRYKETFYEALCIARQKNHRFCFIPDYADLYTFFSTLYEELSLFEYSEDLDRLKKSLLEFFECYHTMVLATTASSSTMSGCSIYFPVSDRDVAYNNTFALQTHWPDFLKNFHSPNFDQEKHDSKIRINQSLGKKVFLKH